MTSITTHPDMILLNDFVNSRIEQVLMLEAEEYDKRFGPPAGQQYLLRVAEEAQRAIRRNT